MNEDYQFPIMMTFVLGIFATVIDSWVFSILFYILSLFYAITTLSYLLFPKQKRRKK